MKTLLYSFVKDEQGQDLISIRCFWRSLSGLCRALHQCRWERGRYLDPSEHQTDSRQHRRRLEHLWGRGPHAPHARTAARASQCISQLVRSHSLSGPDCPNKSLPKPEGWRVPPEGATGAGVPARCQRSHSPSRAQTRAARTQLAHMMGVHGLDRPGLTFLEPGLTGNLCLFWGRLSFLVWARILPMRLAKRLRRRRAEWSITLRRYIFQNVLGDR